jgi:hypothetical protein
LLGISQNMTWGACWWQGFHALEIHSTKVLESQKAQNVEVHRNSMASQLFFWWSVTMVTVCHFFGSGTSSHLCRMWKETRKRRRFVSIVKIASRFVSLSSWNLAYTICQYAILCQYSIMPSVLHLLQWCYLKTCFGTICTFNQRA